MDKYRINKYDIITISAIIIITILSVIIIFFTTQDGNSVLIEQNGQVLYRISLYEDQTVDIKDNHGKITNRISIKDGQIKMDYASCPDKICVHHKEISKNNESIICLPNRVVITIISDEKEIDGVAS